MKQIIRYKADDGSEHSTAKAAEARDKLAAQVNQAMAPLGAPLGALSEDVESGKGWIQHNLETVLRAKDAIIEICRAQGYAEHYPVFNNPGRDIHPLSIVGRVLDDNGGPLNLAWSRFCRIDEKGREHQQCYYAYTAGPDKRHICVEDRS